MKYSSHARLGELGHTVDGPDRIVNQFIKTGPIIGLTHDRAAKRSEMIGFQIRPLLLGYWPSRRALPVQLGVLA